MGAAARKESITPYLYWRAMSAPPENSIQAPISRGAPSKSRSPKSGAPRSTKSYGLELIQVKLSTVLGLDPEISEFFQNQDFNFETVTDFKVWSKEAAKWSYQICPMILAKRRNGFEILGSGRTWRVAQSLFEPEEFVPALVLTGIKKIPTEVKFQVVAAELFALSSEFRTRPSLPAKLLNLWEQLNAKGVQTIAGGGAKAFSRGTGYSLKALKSTRTADKPTQRHGRISKESAAQTADSSPVEPRTPRTNT